MQKQGKEEETGIPAKSNCPLRALLLLVLLPLCLNASGLAAPLLAFPTTVSPQPSYCTVLFCSYTCVRNVRSYTHCSRKIPFFSLLFLSWE